MAPSGDSTLEAVGEGGVGCGEADGPDVAGEGDRPPEPEERDVALGALLVVAGVGDDLGHGADLGLRGVGVQLVGPQLYLIVFLEVLPVGRGAKAGTQETSPRFLLPAGDPRSIHPPRFWSQAKGLLEPKLHISFIL